jgi:hypothetical protein
MDGRFDGHTGCEPRGEPGFRQPHGVAGPQRLMCKEIPERQVTFVVLANSDGLSRWRRIGDDADVTASPAAALFLNWYSMRRVEDRAVP